MINNYALNWSWRFSFLSFRFTFDEISAELIVDIARSCRHTTSPQVPLAYLDSSHSSTNASDASLIRPPVDRFPIVLFDGGPRMGQLLKKHRQHLMHLLELTDIILATEEEAEMLTGIHYKQETFTLADSNKNVDNDDGDDAHERTTRIAAAESNCIHLFDLCPSASIVAIKMGSLGTCIGFNNSNNNDTNNCNHQFTDSESSSDTNYETITIHHTPGFDVTVADTVGTLT